jgi:hypothetical protein
MPVMFRPDRYRRLRPAERELLEAMLEGGGSELDPLRAQLETAMYRSAWFPGSASFEIHAPTGPRFAAPGAEPGEGVIVRAREVHRGGTSRQDGEVIGSLFLWVLDGALSALEYQGVDGSAPTSLPSRDQLGD